MPKAGEQCDHCFRGRYQDGPFDTDKGSFVFCSQCFHSEDIKKVTVEVKNVTSVKEITVPQVEESSKGNLALRVIAMPKDANPVGTIFGGIIMCMIDQAAFVEARKHGMHRWVTASMDKVDFLKPVRVGDTVSLYAKTIKTGTKSVQIGVEVEVDRYDTNSQEHVCSASITMVSVDPKGKPIPFDSPSTIQYRA